MTNGAASEAIAKAKAVLRKAILERRDAADSASRILASQIITPKLFALPAYHAATVVAAYSSFGSEFDTSDFLARVLSDGKQLFLPRMIRAERTLELRRVIDPGANLVTGVWGIREPAQSCPLLSGATVDFMLVPGVAFTTNGARLGYGGGFYDRLLASLDRRTARIAAAFQLQIVDQVPEGPHDQRIDQVVTEHSARPSPLQ